MALLGYKKLDLEMESIEKCPLCENTVFETLSTSDKFNHGIKNVICTNCSFVFTNPAPTKMALDNFYKKDYWKFYFSPEPSEKMLKITKNLERANYHYEYIKNEIDLDEIESFVDVGGGEGAFISTLKNKSKNGEEFFLVEPSDRYREFAISNKSCTQAFESIESIPKTDKKRLISMVHVFEHISDPLKFLNQLSKFINEGDYLFIDVPNVFEYWHVSEVHIAHTNHFNTSTLSLALESSNFEVVNVGEHSPIRHPKSVRGIFRKGNKIGISKLHDTEKNIIKAKKSFDKVNNSAPEWHSFQNMLKLKVKKLLNIDQY